MREAESSILDRPLTVTAFPDVHGVKPKRYFKNLRDLVRPIRERTAPTKAGLPLLKLASFGDVPTIKGSFRHDANVTGIDGVEADYDGESLSLDEAANQLRETNIAALLYTSPSHKTDAPRWRVLCPCSRTLPASDRSALVDRLNGVLGGVLASESWALSQTFYFGRVADAPEHRVEIIDGRAIDLATEIVGTPRPRSSLSEKPTVPNDNRLGLSVEEAREILAKLPFEWCDSRDGWIRCGMALSHEGFGEDGYEMWCAWAAQSDKFDEADSKRVWNSFRNSTDRPVRMATLKAAAHAIEIAEMFDELPANDHDDLLGDSVQNAVVPSDKATKTAAGDLDAGQRFARAYDNKFVHIYSDKRWLRWGGSRWEQCAKGEEVEAAKVLAKKLFHTAAFAVGNNPNEHNKTHLAYALRLIRDGSRLHAVLNMARSIKNIVKLADDFDRDPMLLGVTNGVLDLRSGTLIAPSPAQLISKQAGTKFNPSARCPKWLKFLGDVLPDDSIRRFVQLCAGYTLTGNIDEEKLFFAHGTGANGKSVFANVLAALLGDYAVTVGAGLLTKSRHEGEAERLVASLIGTRLSLANETRAGDVWDDKRVKELASRERIQSRKLYSEAFSFLPTHKLWIRGNHLPGVLDNSEGFWRRLIPIAFEQQLPQEKRIPDLDRQIIAEELPGILLWALEGCLAWQREGLHPPSSITRATSTYRDDTDILAQWLNDCCAYQSDARVKVEDAYQSYRFFCAHQGMSAPSKPAFSRQLLQRGLRRDPSRTHGRRIIGLVVRPGHFGFDELEEAA